jgi:hypothetical protein
MDAELKTALIKIVSDLLIHKGLILNKHGIFDRRASIKWNREGWDKSGCLEPFTDVEIDNEAILKAIKLIPLLVKKTTRKGLVGSYGLKHSIEKLISVDGRGSFLSNGEAILAMLYKNYTYKISEEGSWNCNFLAEFAKNDYQDSTVVEEKLKF